MAPRAAGVWQTGGETIFNVATGGKTNRLPTPGQGLFRLAQHFGDDGTVVSAVLQPIGEPFRHKVAVLVGAVPPVAAVGIRQCLLEKGDTAFL